MAAQYDIALISNDIVFVNGDFAIAQSDQQHIQDTINAFPGWWKERPADGVGALAYLNSSGMQQALARSIQINLKSDGYQAGVPVIVQDSTGKIFVDPNVPVI